MSSNFNVSESTNRVETSFRTNGSGKVGHNQSPNAPSLSAVATKHTQSLSAINSAQRAIEQVIETKKEFVSKVVGAGKISDMLKANLAGVAKAFVGQKEVCDTITATFKSQVDTLRDVLGEKGFGNLKGLTYDDGNSGMARGLILLNQFLERYNSDGLGGFERTNCTEPQKLFATKGETTTSLGCVHQIDETSKKIEKLEKTIEDLEAEIKGLEGKKASVKEIEVKEALSEQIKAKEALRGQAQKKLDIEKESRERTEAVLAQMDLSTLRDEVLGRLETLTSLAGENAPSYESMERMLNLIQQNAFGSWLYNDIIPAFVNEPNPVPAEKFSKLNSMLTEEMKLNGKARGTPMFSEVSVKNGTVKLGQEVIIEGKPKVLPSPTVAKFRAAVYACIAGISLKKCGLRGRSGAKDEQSTNQLLVVRRPLYNTKGEEISFKSELESRFSKVFNTGGIPKISANGDALPADLIQKLNNEKADSTIREFAQKLIDRGFLREENGQYKSAPSYSKVIDDAGFPTYCGVSGTTGEMVTSFFCNLKGKPKTDLENTLKDLMAIANGDMIPREGTDDFSQFFAPIAVFMEVGHFHTTAEVLGGFYSVACAKHDPQINDADMRKGFGNLLTALREHPECFLGKVSEAA